MTGKKSNAGVLAGAERAKEDVMRRMRDYRSVLVVGLLLAFVAACAPTFEGKLRQAAGVQKTIFDASQQAALGLYETRAKVWISQVKAGTLTVESYRAKRKALDQQMDDLAVLVEKGKAAQRALLDGLALLEKGVGTQASLTALEADFARFLTSVLGAVDKIRVNTAT